jgi:hypothetical protein
MLISNYGLFWQRKYVHFGYGGNKGRLVGMMRQKESVLVDFREQIGIYVLYDKDFIPIYVGQAGNGNATLFARLQYHTTDYLRNRWEYFTWFGSRRVNANRRLAAHDSTEKTFKARGGSILDGSEDISIATEDLKLNKQGSKIRDAAEEYLQVVDENAAEMSIEDARANLEGPNKQKRAIEKQEKRKVNSKKVGRGR